MLTDVTPLQFPSLTWPYPILETGLKPVLFFQFCVHTNNYFQFIGTHSENLHRKEMQLKLLTFWLHKQLLWVDKMSSEYNKKTSLAMRLNVRSNKSSSKLNETSFSSKKKKLFLPSLSLGSGLLYVCKMGVPVASCSGCVSWEKVRRRAKSLKSGERVDFKATLK